MGIKGTSNSTACYYSKQTDNFHNRTGEHFHRRRDLGKSRDLEVYSFDSGFLNTLATA